MLGDLHKTRPDNVRLDIKAIQRNDKGIGFVCFDDDAIVGFVPVHISKLSCFGISDFVASINISGWAYALRMRSQATLK